MRSMFGRCAACRGVLPPSDSCGSSAQPSGMTMAYFMRGIIATGGEGREPFFRRRVLPYSPCPTPEAYKLARGEQLLSDQSRWVRFPQFAPTLLRLARAIFFSPLRPAPHRLSAQSGTPPRSGEGEKDRGLSHEGGYSVRPFRHRERMVGSRKRKPLSFLRL